MSKFALILSGAEVLAIGILILVIRSKNRKIETLKADNSAKAERINELAALLNDAAAQVQEIADVQQQIQTAEKQAETEMPQESKPAAAGDVDSRLDRFNSL